MPTPRLSELPQTHLSPQQQRIYNALRNAETLIGNLMPGVRHIALQDYAALNNTPLEIAAVLKELSDPKTTEWTQERCHGIDPFPVTKFPS